MGRVHDGRDGAYAAQQDSAALNGGATASVAVLAGGGVAALALDRDEAQRVGRVGPRPLKRTVDVVVSVTVLLLALPVMVIIALGVVLESSGPVFYCAERVARGGRTIRMLKFRKMRRDADGLRLTMYDDQRLTRVGSVIAHTKLDELPQFINVLRGEMSLVGPRPEDPHFVAARRGDYAEILEVRPGITGLSQIAFADETRILSAEDRIEDYLTRIFPQKCALDRLYVRTCVGLGSDLRILAWTTVAVLLRRQVAVDRKTGKMNLRRRP